MKLNRLVVCLLAIIPAIACADVADIGVVTTPLSTEQTATCGLPEDSGFFVTEVFADTPAADLGLARHDIITKLNGNPVFSSANFADLVAGTCAPDGQVTVDWLRNGAEMSGQTTLDETCSKEELQERYMDQGGVQVGSFGIKIDSLTSDIMTLGTGGGSSGISVSAVYSVRNAHGTVTAKPAEDGKKHVTIKDNDDNVIFDDTIAAGDLEMVPEPHRNTVASALLGNMIQIQLGSGGISRESIKTEKDIQDLLDDTGEESQRKSDDSPKKSNQE